MRGVWIALMLCALMGTAAAAPDVRAAPLERRQVAAPPKKAEHRSKATRPLLRPVIAGGISCVPYARMVTGMDISGNGGTWWYNAAGLYARGQRPEAGAVLAFRASGGMGRGHVAVVSRVLGPRHVLIDHANWGGPGIRRGSVMRNIGVIDVSDANDWTAVRVQVGYEPGVFGRVYPTFGFIYNRSPGATLQAEAPARPGSRYAEVADLAAPRGGAQPGRR